MRLNESLANKSKLEERNFSSVNKIILATPNTALALFKQGAFKNTVLEAIIIDKVDMHHALDLSGDLSDLG